MKWITTVFSIDLRSLALFRICLALLILLDLYLRFYGTSAVHDATGVAGVSFWQEIGAKIFTILSMADLPSLLRALLIYLTALVALCLLFGYRSRLMAMLAFVFMILISAQTQPVYQVADHLIISMSIWLVFLPVGARYSIDTAVDPRFKEDANDNSFPPEQRQRYFSIASVALILQALLILLSAWSLVNLTLLTLLIPSAVWIWLAKQRKRAPMDSIVIYYDEDCGFCLKMVLMLRELLLSRYALIYPAQHHPDIYAIMERENSWVVQDANGSYHIHWHAMQHLFAQRLVFKPIALIMLFPPFMALGNAVYSWVADNRSGIVSTLSAIFTPWRPVSLTPGTVGQVMATCLLVAMFAHGLLKFS